MDTIRQNENLIFYVEMDTNFKNILKYLLSSHKKGSFLFSKDKITYSQSTLNNILLNDIVIYTEKLPCYIHNSKNDILLGFDLYSLFNILKSGSKKETIHMYMLKEDPLIYIRTVTENSLYSIRPFTSEKIQYEVPIYNNTPNCFIDIEDFYQTCKGLSSIKCKSPTMECYKNAVVFHSNIDGEFVARIDTYGTIQDDPILKYTVPISIIKSLSLLKHLTSIDTNNNIAIFAHDNNPIQFLIPLYNYGVLKIYITDSL
jgi:hypothetical protein